VANDKRGNICHVFNEIVCQKIYWGDFVDIEENDVVVDIGFNFGLFSTTSMFKKPSKILGFEPNPSLVKIFKENFTNDTIQLYNYAVSDRDSKMTFYENGDFGMSTIKEDVNVEYRTKQYEVDTISINSLISKFNLEKIDYLKIDCEGSEFEIFESISEMYLTNNIKKIAIEFHDYLYGEKVQKLISKLEKCGFEIIIKNDEGVPLGMIYAKKIIHTS
jgi:FkbM family methyltransferase